MPEEVKERTHCMACHNKSFRGLIFTDRDNKPIDENEEADYDPNSNPTPEA